MKGQVIACIPTDTEGNKLWIKNYTENNGKMYVEYKSTYNDMPFTKTQIFYVDNMVVITGNDGTVLYRFSPQWLLKISKMVEQI